MNLLSLAEASTDSFRQDDNLVALARSNLDVTVVLESESSRSSSVHASAIRLRPAHSDVGNMFAGIGGVNRNKVTDLGRSSQERKSSETLHLHAPHPSASFERTYSSAVGNSNSFDDMNYGGSTSRSRRLEYTSRISAANVDAAVSASKASLSAAEASAAGLRPSNASHEKGNSNSLNQSAAGGSKAVLAALKALQDKLRRVEAERDSALDECTALHRRIQEQDSAKAAGVLAVQAEKDALMQEKRAAVLEMEAKWKQEVERSRSLSAEIKGCMQLQAQLEGKIADQAQQGAGYRARLEEADLEKQRLYAKEEQVTQTVVWESRRHEDEKALMQQQLRTQQEQVLQARYECEMANSRTKELEILVKSLTESRYTRMSSAGKSSEEGSILTTAFDDSDSEEDTSDAAAQHKQNQGKGQGKGKGAPVAAGAKSAASNAKASRPAGKTVALAVQDKNKKAECAPSTLPPKVPVRDPKDKDKDKNARLGAKSILRGSESTKGTSATLLSTRKRTESKDSMASSHKQRRTRSDSVDSRNSWDSVESASSVQNAANTHKHAAKHSKSVVNQRGASPQSVASARKEQEGIAYGFLSPSPSPPAPPAQTSAPDHHPTPTPHYLQPTVATILQGSHVDDKDVHLREVQAHEAQHDKYSDTHNPHHPVPKPSPPKHHTHHHTLSHHAHLHASAPKHSPNSDAQTQMPAPPVLEPLPARELAPAQPVLLTPAPAQLQAQESKSPEDPEVSAYNSGYYVHASANSNAQAEISGIAQMDESIDVVRAIYGHDGAMRSNSSSLSELRNTINDAHSVRRSLEHTGLGARPRAVLHGSSESPESYRAARAAAAEKELGGTFGSPPVRSAINTVLMSTKNATPARSDANTSVGGSTSSAGARRGNTLNSVIVSLEEEFTALNNKYRKLLSTCSSAAGAKHTEQEAQDADELVTVIHKLHRKGEQLRKLRVGSPSMNMFSSSASATYIENMTNTNLVGGNRNATTVSAMTHSQNLEHTPRFINLLPSTLSSHLNTSSHGSASAISGSPRSGHPAPHRASNTGQFTHIKDDVLDFDVQNLNAPATIGSSSKI